MTANRFTLSIACALCWAAIAAATPGELPARVEFSISAIQDGEGFLAITGRSNLPAGWRVLLIASGSPERGVESTENALVAVGPGGRFRHETVLSLPLNYTVTAELSAAGNPERATSFDDRIGARIGEGIAAVAVYDGTYKLVSHTAFRIGTEDQEHERIAASLAELAARAQRLERDREQIGRILTAADPAAASSFYISWARIRSGKEHEMALDAPTIDPLFGSLDLAIRDAWRTLDGVGLALLARAIGDDVETGRLEDRLRKYDRQIKRVRRDLAELKGKAP